MCGRFGQIQKAKKYANRFGLSVSDNLDHEPNFNTDIGNRALISTSDRRLIPSMFGFTPGWSPKLTYFFNARAEGDLNPANDPGYKGATGIFEKSSFRTAIRSQRAVVPVDYFVEGPEKERLKKPFIIRRTDQEPFLLAGIWNLWTDKSTGESIHTFSIITTPNNPLVAQIGHHRSPMVIPDEKMETWLNPKSTIETISQLMIPFEDTAFEAVPVDPKIGKRNTESQSNNDSGLILPTGPALLPEVS